MDERINRIKQVTRCKRMVIFLTGSGNFRFDIAKQQSYKGNRSGVEKPFHYETVGTYLIERYGAVVVEGREADDALAIGLRTTKSSILCSRDKDLWTVEGWHYRWACGDHQPEVLPHYVTKEKADAKFFTQMLIGDDTDNILGCALRKDVLRGGVEIKSRYIPIPFAKRRKLLRFKIGKKLCKNWRVGVGAVEAKRLVDATDGSVEQLYQMVEQQYQKHCGPHWEDVMLENARLLYMGQSKDKLFEWTWIL